jgi:hypothetical protein
MLTSVAPAKDRIMTRLNAYPALHLPQPLPARLATSLGHLWRALVGGTRGPRAVARVSNRDALEREALAGLGEHMLKDIGASSWLVASAVTQTRDEVQRRIDAGLY